MKHTQAEKMEIIRLVEGSEQSVSETATESVVESVIGVGGGPVVEVVVSSGSATGWVVVVLLPQAATSSTKPIKTVRIREGITGIQPHLVGYVPTQ